LSNRWLIRSRTVLFFIHCIDKPGAGALRAETRPAHLEYLRSFGDKVVVGGPTLAEDGATATGSVLIVDLPDADAAARFAADDPYARAGLFASTTIAPWRKVVFNPPAA
jgi:uncharacterized protein